MFRHIVLFWVWCF